MLVVRQCYPVKTRGLQSCEVTRSNVMDEASRVITSMGTVVKTMTDGRTTVLFASGTVSQLLPNSTLVPCTTQTEQESPRRPTTPTKGDRETPTKKREWRHLYMTEDSAYECPTPNIIFSKLSTELSLIIITM